jgi:hypothetical protein
MADKGAKSMALLLGMPKGGAGASEGDEPDMAAERETAAASAFMKAVKGSDPSAVVSTFRELKDACEASYVSEELPEEE